MIKLDFAKNKTYYVVGLGKSNTAVLKALKKAGADIRVWDDNPDNLKGFDDKQVRQSDKAPWSKIKAVIVAPGIAPSHDIVKTARDKDIPVICDVDLYCQSQPSAHIIGITGTNGKSTVTALVHHILGDQSQMGGNIGVPVLDLKSRAKYTVLELSSYQLDYSPNLKLDVAVLLNISPDHLEWHETMDNYVTAKSKILTNADTKIISVDDDYSKSIYKDHDNAIPLSIYADGIPFNQQDFPKLRGQHNLQNILAAYSVCHSLGMDHDDIIEKIKSFDGLEHRQYLVRTINGIAYINDSKATNVEATRQALTAFRNIFWIAGGRAKDGGLSGIENDLDMVQRAFIYGESAPDFYDFLSSRGIAVTCYDVIDDALAAAHHQAQSMRGEPTGSPTVLLSPAAASFDQFKNFELRGNHFVDLVHELEEE